MKPEEILAILEATEDNSLVVEATKLVLQAIALTPLGPISIPLIVIPVIRLLKSRGVSVKDFINNIRGNEEVRRLRKEARIKRRQLRKDNK